MRKGALHYAEPLDMEKTPSLPRPWSTWLLFLNFAVAMINLSNLVVGYWLFGELSEFVVEVGFAFWATVVQLLCALAALFVLIVEPGSASRRRSALLWVLPVVLIGQGLTLVSLALRFRYEHEHSAPVIAGGAIALIYAVLGGKAWSELLRLVMLERANRS